VFLFRHTGPAANSVFFFELVSSLEPNDSTLCALTNEGGIPFCVKEEERKKITNDEVILLEINEKKKTNRDLDGV
jgi:hypothetical protein